jgi:hypothetical protein
MGKRNWRSVEGKPYQALLVYFSLFRGRDSRRAVGDLLPRDEAEAVVGFILVWEVADRNEYWKRN